jgi:ADP-heptose:LPS heptosyltransferase
MKNFIFFRTDRLGDFIITTSIIKAIKNKYKDARISVVCSKINSDFIKKYRIIDKIYVYNKNFSIFEKFFLLSKIISKNYYASFAFDGKSFSNYCNIFINSKYKLGLVYRYKILNFWLSKPNFLYNKFYFNKFETFTSKKNLVKIEHLPQKLINLGNFFDLKLNTLEKYYFENDLKINNKFTLFKKKFLKKNYILFHLDEKWIDIKSIENELFANLNILQKKTKKQIVITSYKNKFPYFYNLKKNIQENKNSQIKIIENTNLYLFEKLIKNSYYSISCHSGFLVQIAGSNSAKIIDIINKNDYLWYSCWKPKNTFHKFIYKSYKNKISLNNIFKEILKIIKNNE